MIKTAMLVAILGCPAKADQDQRAYCYAHQQSSAAQCLAIASPSLREQCRGELGREFQHCLKISDAVGRFMCRRAKITTGL